MNKTTTLTVAANLSVANVHDIQRMIEFFEIRIRDLDEDMYKAFDVCMDEDEEVTVDMMHYCADYLRDLRERLDGVDNTNPESNGIITIEQDDATMPNRIVYKRIDNLYNKRMQTLCEEAMIEHVKAFETKACEYASYDNQTELDKLCHDDIVVEFHGKRVSIPTNADSVEALIEFIKATI